MTRGRVGVPRGVEEKDVVELLSGFGESVGVRGDRGGVQSQTR